MRRRPAATVVPGVPQDRAGLADGAREGDERAGEPGAVVTLSRRAREILNGAAADEPRDGTESAGGARDDGLTKQERRQVEQLRARDAEVRVHEAAHAAAAGGLGGAPSFDYVTGPDGKRYAVGGEVSIDTSPARTPEETIAKARTIRAAATAPASPSAQDMAVAAAAARMEAAAQTALRERRAAEQSTEAGPLPSSRGASEGADGTEAARKAEEADRTMMQLAREQFALRGAAGHSHMETSCGFCQRSAAAYL